MANGELTNLKFEKAKQMLESGLIPDFQTIFSIAPPTSIATATKIHNLRLKAKIEDPSLFKMRELMDIAAVLNIDDTLLFKLALDTIKSNDSAEPA
ncbi:hypothetical protein [Rufibacter sp. XAAS-G3-1]|uniref:hypothetical protein n=1 Tax=Rufibacter sp. XAAS-G3-1 TaxID=2729134 RepID=UPI0015E7DC50|nr:hypothetical protein [Rufibacter sp. XAAS-G3-1]